MDYSLVIFDRVYRKLGNIYDWGVQDSGVKAARTFVNKIYKSIFNIKKHPYQFSIEPLTVETQKQWRSMVAHPYFKVIFSIDELEHKIYIVDIWDTRMDPEDLQSHINKL